MPLFDAGIDLTRYTPDGNAFLVLGRAKAALREAGATDLDVETFYAEATTRDYQSLVDACRKWLHVTDSSRRP